MIFSDCVIGNIGIESVIVNNQQGARGLGYGIAGEPRAPGGYLIEQKVSCGWNLSRKIELWVIEIPFQYEVTNCKGITRKELSYIFFYAKTLHAIPGDTNDLVGPVR